MKAAGAALHSCVLRARRAQGELAMDADLGIGRHRTDRTLFSGVIDPPRRPPLYVWRIGAAALSFYAALWLASVVVLWGAESSLVFETGLSRQFTAPLDRRIFEPVALHAPDGLTLEGVVLAHAGAAAPYWVLFCPAAGTSVHGERVQHQLQELWELGYNVLAFDYRGFGENRGSPTEEGVYADGASAYAYLTRQRGVPATRVIFAGRSLGSAVAVELATRVDAAGVRMFSAIDSVPRTAARLFPYAPTSFLTRNRFDSRTKVQTLHIPIVMVHAVDDALVPVSAARAMFREIRAPKKLVETDGGHHDAGFTVAANLGAELATFWPVVALDTKKPRATFR
jgi:pimeloyl-ACP methyl ester carboxylesterase